MQGMTDSESGEHSDGDTVSVQLYESTLHTQKCVIFLHMHAIKVSIINLVLCCDLDFIYSNHHESVFT